MLAIGLFVAFTVAVVAHHEMANRKLRRCDACRIEAALTGRSTWLRAHACSKRRWPFQKKKKGAAASA